MRHEIWYNENDLKKGAMLAQLMKDGHIPKGDIDTRSIKEVKAHEIQHYRQCHFFAGIGLWAYAYSQATPPRINPNRSVWTGSCPCQDYSSAGQRKGAGGDKDLWPYWGDLAVKCHPATILGEQVASAIAYGWLDRIYDDLEKEKYSIAAAVLPACSIKAPHRRERLFFVANSDQNGCEASTPSEYENQECNLKPRGTLGDPQFEGLERQPRETGAAATSKPGIFDGIEFIPCKDGKARPIKPGVSLLVNGDSERVPLINALGDGLVWEVAKEFIEAAM